MRVSYPSKEEIQTYSMLLKAREKESFCNTNLQSTLSLIALFFYVCWYPLTYLELLFFVSMPLPTLTWISVLFISFDAPNVWNHAENPYNLINREVRCIYTVPVDTQVYLTKKMNSSLRFRASQLLQSHALICIDVNIYIYIQGLRNKVPCELLQLGSGLVKTQLGILFNS